MTYQYRLGLLAALCLGVLAGLGIVALLLKKKVLDMHFDERQERARGKAFQYGFFTLLGCLYAYGLLDVVLDRWCDVLTGVTLCAAVSLLVFAATCILKDAYLSLRENPRQIMTMFFLFSAINLAFGAVYFYRGELVEEGILTFRAVNPIIGATTLLILIVYIINYLLRDREEAE